MSVPPPPADIYLDTSTVVAAIVQGSDHSVASAACCAALIEHGSRVYFSQLLRLELAQAIRKLATRQQSLPPDIRNDFDLDSWGTNLFVRQRWMDFGVRQFENLLDRFAETFELPIRPKTWRSSLSAMVDFQLRAYDAIHVATAREYHVRHLATADRHYLNVPDLRIWLTQDPQP
ncbi:MAG: PIN domain-containing protein [Chloroflexota bacterium]|nr:PIN domain-containing protein [Chloroflexota bacterium]MDP9471114.1 PIN domain-containing protein [Chloroflexota bacterium]